MQRLKEKIHNNGATYEKAIMKHAYSNILNILPAKKWKFSDKNTDSFQFLLIT